MNVVLTGSRPDPLASVVLGYGLFLHRHSRRIRLFLRRRNMELVAFPMVLADVPARSGRDYAYEKVEIRRSRISIVCSGDGF